MNVPPGRLIVVEGLEGAGKSTAISTIKRFLSDKVPELILTREPGGTQVGETLRALIKEKHATETLDPRTELLLMYASRVQLIEQVIKPALARGVWVLADRFELSSYAYQGGGRELDTEMIEQLSAFCVGTLKPDLTIFLDVSPEFGLKRVLKRGKIDRIEAESLAFFTRVYHAYHAKIKQLDNAVIINGAMPLKEVQQSIGLKLEQFMAQDASSTT